ncbi:unnamed protein product [Caretta caretta]
MATVEKLQEEASCSICLEYFQDPVSIHCGHNFCRACITQCWGELAVNFSCPQCRQTAQQRNFRLNRELANMVELVKQLKLPPAKEPEAERVCEKHREPLKLFCVEEQQLICLVCRESWAHGAHAAVPIEEAAQKYKERVKARLQALREEREKLLEFKLTGERRSWEYLEKIKKERQRIGFEFQQLRQFLEEQERLLLARLEELDRITKWQKETVTRFPMEISHLNSLISELEGKCQQPASDFLQDIRITLSRCKMFQQPMGISPELEKRLSDFSQQTIALKETLRKFKDTLALGLETSAGRSLAWGVDTTGRKANVTLDPDTAHPQLVLSADGKGVRRGHEQRDLPDNPERFDSVLSVLGREGFASGRCYWEVEGKTDAEREKIVSQFKQLHQFLEEEERLLLARLGELEKEIVKLQDENITKLSAEISRLSELISEMEGKCQQPASEFLQDIRSILSRCEQGKFQQPVEMSPDLAKRLGDFTQKNIVLKEILKEFQGALVFELQTATNVTLDPDTAHP